MHGSGRRVDLLRGVVAVSALVVVVSLLGVFGQGQRTTDAVLQIVGELGPASAVDTLRTPIQQLVESPSAGFALIVGILGALWSASGYAFTAAAGAAKQWADDIGEPAEFADRCFDGFR